MGFKRRDPNAHITYEVSEKNKKLRMALIIVLLAIGVVAITSGIVALLNTDPGWQAVEITTEDRNCSANFVFQYYFADSGVSATELNKKVSAVYEDMSVKAYWLFTPDESSDDYKNVYYINHHVNESITVDPVLYQAFQKLKAADNRYIYLGPACSQYNSLFFNPDDAQVQALDPEVNDDTREYLQNIAGFAADPAHIDLKLLGNNTVKLVVSPEYLDFARENEIDCFLDFSYMANAFIIDYFADTLIANGLTQCYLVSVDGYTRNLWQGSDSFSMNLFDLDGTTIYPAGTFHYQSPMSIVSMRNFPIAPSDAFYREGANRKILHPYLSLENGRSQSSNANLLGMSAQMSCTDLLLDLQPLFISDRLDTQQLNFAAIWCQNNTIFYTAKDLRFSNLFRGSDVNYQLSYVG